MSGAQASAPRWSLDRPIETERLVLRAFGPADRAAIAAYEGREDVTRYLYWEPRTGTAVDDSLAVKTARVALRGEGDAISAAVVVGATGDVVGKVLLFWRSVVHRQGEIGFVLDPAHHGHGYATEAASAILTAGFDRVGLHRIFGRCDARNRASAAVMTRLGMRREAHLVHNEWFKGAWGDELVHAVLDDEWRARRP